MGVDDLKGVVMAGGRATRFGRPTEKALLEVNGKTLLHRAAEALRCGSLEGVLVAITDRNIGTMELADRAGIEVIITSGIGYHEDTLELIDRLGRFASLNVDVPFARAEHTEAMIRGAIRGSCAAVVPAEIAIGEIDPESVLISPEGRRMVWAGLNVVSNEAETRLMMIEDPLLTININTEEDLTRANRIAVKRNL